MSDIVREIVEIECAQAVKEATANAAKKTIENIKILFANQVPLSIVLTSFSNVLSEKEIRKIYNQYKKKHAEQTQPSA